MDFKVLLDIFLSFLKTGLMTFGGGPAGTALVQSEACDIKKWMTVEEFASSYALSSALPGPIATKLATVVGYKVAGVPGAISGLLATILPTAVAVILLLNVYNKFKDAAWLAGMMKAVMPVVVVMIAFSAASIFQKNVKLDNWTLGITLVSCFALYKEVSPVWVILGAFAVGGVFMRS